MTQKNSLAQQAMQTLDAIDESVMSHFVYHARRSESEDVLWQHRDTEMLYDGSFVSLVPSTNLKPVAKYLFAWIDDHDEPQIAARPASGDAPPPPPEPSLHVVQWPSTETIQKNAYQRAAKAASKKLRPDSDTNSLPLFDLTCRHLAVMDSLAPDLRKAVNHEILGESCPQDIIDKVESYLDDYAEDAIKRVPRHQWEALVNHIALEMA